MKKRITKHALKSARFGKVKLVQLSLRWSRAKEDAEGPSHLMSPLQAAQDASHNTEQSTTLPSKKYKITILNSHRRGKETITRQLHHFDGKFHSVTDIKAHLMDELGEEAPCSIHFDVGYYEKRSTKNWLVTSEDLEAMYSSLKCDDISLWCDAESQDDKKSDKKDRKKNGGTSVRLEEEDVDDHFATLTEMHGMSTVYCSEDCGLKLLTVVLMIVLRFHLLFLCLRLHLSGLRRTLTDTVAAVLTKAISLDTAIVLRMRQDWITCHSPHLLEKVLICV